MTSTSPPIWVHSPMLMCVSLLSLVATLIFNNDVWMRENLFTSGLWTGCYLMNGDVRKLVCDDAELM